MTSADFHGVVTSMSGNRILDLVAESLKEVWFDRVAGTAYEPEERERERKDHEAIARAIAAGNGSRAERLMRVHMEEFTAEVAAKYPGMMDEVVDWK